MTIYNSWYELNIDRNNAAPGRENTNMTAAGISARSVNLQSIRHILTSAIMPSTAASKNIKMPSPKHS